MPSVQPSNDKKDGSSSLSNLRSLSSATKNYKTHQKRSPPKKKLSEEKLKSLKDLSKKDLINYPDYYFAGDISDSSDKAQKRNEEDPKQRKKIMIDSSFALKNLKDIARVISSSDHGLALIRENKGIFDASLLNLQAF